MDVSRKNVLGLQFWTAVVPRSILSGVEVAADIVTDDMVRLTQCRRGTVTVGSGVARPDEEELALRRAIHSTFTNLWCLPQVA